MKKYIPYNKRNQNDTSTKPASNQTNTTPNHNETKTNKDATKGTSTTTSEVNKIETDTNDDMYDTFPSFIWDLVKNKEELSSQQDIEDTTSHINVVLSSDATMVSEFPVSVGDCMTTCLLDTGASHSLMSYDCFKQAFHSKQLQENQGIKVKNASGINMGPIGICNETITLGPKNFSHAFIVCTDLTSSVILGLDFSSRFLIGTDWTKDRKMYLHQGKYKLIEGTVTGTCTGHT